MAEKATIVVFSGDLDKVLAAFVIATGCAAQGMEVTMFYTFWGLNVVKKDKGPIAGAKNWMQKMMGMMNRGGISRLPLSKFNMAGMGRSMMKKLMKKTDGAPRSEMLAMARDLDVKMWACKMSMDVMGVAKEDLIPEVDKIVGVAAYAAEAQQSKINLFI